MATHSVHFGNGLGGACWRPPDTIVSGAVGMIIARKFAAQEGLMTTTTRLGNVASLSFGVIASMGLMALPLAESYPAMAQTHGPTALTGTVSSAEEGKMEGVVVSAKRPG